MKAQIVAILLVVAFWTTWVAADELSIERLGDIVAAKATRSPDGVLRVSWPRKEVAVQVDGLSMRPFMGLGTWAAFQQSHGAAMLMGDTVVFQDEVNPAIDAAFANGLEVTALHNHFFFDEPKVYFMHIGGAGEPEKLSQGVKAVWDAIKKVRAERAEPAKQFGGQPPATGALSAEKLATTVGGKHESQDGIVKLTLGREATMHGQKFGASMGLTTWAAFSGSDALAVVDGDFAMTAGEVQPVLRALRKGGLNIVALHQHMVGETPAYFFVHFWGKDKAEKLAGGLQGALAAQQSASRTAVR